MRSTTEPFKVTCELVDGRINSADGLVFLDAILYHAWFAKHAPKVLQGIYSPNPPPYFGLPLRQLARNRYAASCGFYKQDSLDIEYWVKRPNFADADKIDYFDAGKASKINTASGAERAYRTPNVIRLTGPITFYGYGTIDKVKDLLSYIVAVGKKPAMGWGAIKGWEVEPVAEDWSTWSPEYGLMRPMPVDEYDRDDKGRYKIQQCALRPPSWKTANQAICYVPEVICGV